MRKTEVQYIFTKRDLPLTSINSAMQIQQGNARRNSTKQKFSTAKINFFTKKG